MNSKKLVKNIRGITPIISVILLLMMTIAIAGLAYTWLQRMQTSIQSSSENTSERMISSLKVQLRIEGYTTNCSANAASVLPAIHVKNIGTETAKNVQLYVDDSLQSGAYNATLPAGNSTTYTLSNVSCGTWINRSRKVKVASDETIAESEFTFKCTSGVC